MSTPTYVTTYESVVCQVLVQLREKAGRTQAFMADSVGVTPATWSRIESGQTALSLDQLKGAADALGLSPHAVLEVADQLISGSPNVEVKSKKEITEGVRSNVAQAAEKAGAALASVPISGPLVGAVIGVAAFGLIGGLLSKTEKTAPGK